MFWLTEEDVAAPLIEPSRTVGGVVTFEGLVRDHNEGKAVKALEYEAFDDLALREGERILTEAKERFDLEAVACVHRTGLLQLGDVAIRVEAASAHRREAFEACEWVVDEVKRRVPIWKKEHYADGPSDWINAQGDRVVTEAHFLLPEAGNEGQERLRNARVLIVGVGGLGGPALMYLAAAGVGTIGILDDGMVEPSDLHRQPLFRASDVGRPKARLAAERARALNPFVRVAVLPDRVGSENGLETIRSFDVLLDCTGDEDAARLLNVTAVLEGKALIRAVREGNRGRLHVVEPGGPCLRCTGGDSPRTEGAVLGVVPGVLGTLQAALAIKRILGAPGLGQEVAILDLNDLTIEKHPVSRDPNCAVCGRSRGAESEPA